MKEFKQKRKQLAPRYLDTMPRAVPRQVELGFTTTSCTPSTWATASTASVAGHRKRLPICCNASVVGRGLLYYRIGGLGSDKATPWRRSTRVHDLRHVLRC